jgi:hypothetical protein
LSDKLQLVLPAHIFNLFFPDYGIHVTHKSRNIPAYANDTWQ